MFIELLEATDIEDVRLGFIWYFEFINYRQDTNDMLLEVLTYSQMLSNMEAIDTYTIEFWQSIKFPVKSIIIVLNTPDEIFNKKDVSTSIVNFRNITFHNPLHEMFINILVENQKIQICGVSTYFTIKFVEQKNRKEGIKLLDSFFSI